MGGTVYQTFVLSCARLEFLFEESGILTLNFYPSADNLGVIDRVMLK